MRRKQEEPTLEIFWPTNREKESDQPGVFSNAPVIFKEFRISPDFAAASPTPGAPAEKREHPTGVMARILLREGIAARERKKPKKKTT